MPNVVIEHSNDVKDTKSLIQLCHDHLMESGLFKLETIKVRTLAFEQFLVGGKSEKSFVVINLFIMPGRTMEQKAQLGQSMHQRIKEACQDLSAATSVVVKETSEGLYFKDNG